MQALRLGLVGGGRRGLSLFPLAVQADAGVELAAVCDTRPEVEAAVRAVAPGCRFFIDYEAMLAEGGLDAVLVETPGTCHAAFCIRALDHGLHTLSDIPAVDSCREGEELYRAAAGSRGLFMTGANPNFWGFAERAVELRAQGYLGRISYMEAEYIHDIRYLFAETPWRRAYPPIKYCTHSLGPLLRLIDEDLRYVSCFSTGGQMHAAAEQNDVMTAHFSTENQTVVRLTISFINNAPIGLHSYRVFGTEGYFERRSSRGGIEPDRTLFCSQRFGGRDELVELPVGSARRGSLGGGGHGGADLAMLQAFFAAIRAGGPSPVSAREGLRMTLPGIFAAESAALQGERLRIRYPWDTI